MEQDQKHQIGYGTGLLLLTAVVVAVAGFIGLCVALHVQSAYAGFLFILYWSGIQQMNAKEFVPTLFGALCGTGMAFLLKTLPGMGMAGVLVVAVLTLAATYLTIVRRLQTFVNMTFMLFLTVLAIPALQASADYPDIVAGILLGAAYIAALMFLIVRISSLRASRTAAQPG